MAKKYVSFEFHIGSPSGPVILINIPATTTTESPSPSQKTTVEIARNNFAFFSTDYTYVTTPDMEDVLRGLGFNNLIISTTQNPIDLYIDNDRYIHITGATYRYYKGDNLSAQFGGYAANTFQAFELIAPPSGYASTSVQIRNPDIIGFYMYFSGGPGPSTYYGLDFFSGVIPITDPYAPGGTSGPGGGTGNFDGTGDDIGIPSLPTLSAVDTGLITLFNPTIGELNAFANWLWNDINLNNWHKLFTDPMEAVLGLSIVPVAVPDGGRRAVSVGNMFGVDIVMNVAASQYVEVDCGTLNVNEFWGAYLDYDPFTKAEIYLPYIGIRPLKVDDIMAKPVHVVYHVDILSGGCTAFVQCGGSVLYTYVGQCAASVPIAGKDWTQVINGVLQIGTAIGTMIATEGAATPFVAGMAANGASAINKPNVEKSGGMSGAGGILAVQTPYLILTRPRQALPAYQNGFEGYPSLITATLNDLSGYTEVESVHLDGIPATREEIAEIESLLKGGVIL